MKNNTKQTPAPAPKVSTKQFDFVKELELYHYGESVEVVESARKIVGQQGKVDYTVKVPAEYEGTDYTAVTFKLVPSNKVGFKMIGFTLLVNKTSGAVIEVISAHKDNRKLDEKGLIIELGRFGSENELNKLRKIRHSFMKNMN